MPSALRYWDSCCFVGCLANEDDKVEQCRPVVTAAMNGDLRIVTSALTLAEVIKLKGKPPITRENSAKIREFFEREMIVIRQVDRRVAEYARELIWEHGFHHKDAIHVATALLARVPYLDTFDGDLLKRSGSIGDPPLIIGRPDLPLQLTFEDDLEPDEELPE